MKNIILVLFLSLSSLLYSQQPGRITGIVKDMKTNETIIGAKVSIVGTNYEALTDANGVYLILTIRPGIYSVRADFIGYKSVTKDSVVVRMDVDTKLNFNLTADEIIVNTLEVIATKQGSKTNYIEFNGCNTERITDYNTEEYGKIVENKYKTVIREPLSTFSIDVDAASYSNARRFILQQNQLPYKDAVRIEEFINYFDYQYKPPVNNEPLKTNMEFSECPWDTTKKLLQIGLQSKQIDATETAPGNLVFLIDVSGSMDAPNKLPLLKKSFKLLADNLKENDIVSIVVYAGAAGLVLSPTSGKDKLTIHKALDGLQAGGSTAGGEGIKLAYEIAKNNLINGGNNRVILATDGDFNVGISSTSELVRYIESQKEQGIFLTILGFGMGNYKDNRLQELADKGNGNHYYIDNILEAKKVLVNQITATLFTVAKDVKIQVEFNPARVESYRLIGYENRLLNNDDFTDDKKDAGEIGAGHTVTALYEVILNKSNDKINYDYKYQSLVVKEEAYNSNEIGTVKIRYKEPDSDSSKEINEVLTGAPLAFSKSSDNFRFAAAVAEFAMILRGSNYLGSANYKQVVEIANSAIGEDKYGYRKEFLDLVRRAELLSENK